MDEYSNHANLYNPVVGPFLRSTHNDMVDILQKHGCHEVLDLCCGTGLFVGKAQGAGLNPLGVDLSKDMLRVARTNFPEAKLIECDGTSLPMRNGSFDAVTISFALHEKPREVALDITQEAIRLVRKGGLLVVADYRCTTERKAFFAGWVIKFVEYMAGKDHNTYFKDFMRRGGSEAFFLEAGLDATRRTTHMSGWSGVYVHVKDV